MIGPDDLDFVAGELDPGAAAAVLLMEDLWAASLASATARSTPPVTNVKEVPPCRCRTSRSRWVTTNTGARNGGSSPHGFSPPSNMRRPIT